MPGLSLESLPLWAANKPPAAGDGGILPYLPLIGVVVLFYIMMLRPQQQQERKRKQMIEAMKKNDRVLTSAGIFGTVVSIDGGDRIVLRVDDERNVRLTFSKASIVRVIDPSEKDKDKAAEAV